jgi:hypothetical protein
MASHATEPPLLLGLEERLAADADGIERDRLVARLRVLQQTVGREMDRGLPPEQFRRAAVVRDGCDAAAEVVPRLWAMLHQRRG